MGEYATRKSDGHKIKIGTCESMYYLRHSDRDKVACEIGSVFGCFWRLPYPDEDSVKPGDYDNHNRGLRLYKMVKQPNGAKYAEDYHNAELGDDSPGTIQLRHEASGLLLNVPCHHGEKLPEIGCKAFWNGKGHAYELAFLKSTPEGMLPVIRCRHCNTMWRQTWEQVWDYIEPTMQKQLEQYRNRIDIAA